ncbi:ABC transporter ATP-binding protein [Pseudochelatococcus lubricantis]|uniref:ABC transporter ATP-binding protein n=1 Tax=Pseudochelatococcus lubricantis TaxID=1538102 RepID=UPI0035F023BF
MTPVQSSPAPSLAIENVRKTFTVETRTFAALDDVSLTLRHNEIVSILGPSGCGKSTLLRLVAGLETPDAGALFINGRGPVAGPARDCAIVFQDHRLFPWLTVSGNVDLALDSCRLAPAERRERVRRYIALVGLGSFASAYPRQLSGGMAQRAAIARALVAEPALLLMDEPFGALDSLLRTRLQGELLDIWERNRVTILLVTHDVEEAIYLSDRVVVMQPNPGRIRAVVDVGLPRPRQREETAFIALRKSLLELLS